MCVTLGITGLLFGLAGAASAQPQVIRNITQASQRMELTVNTSRILTLEKRVPKMVVNNPELVSVTPISATQVQIAAKKPGVTQINLWDEDDQVYTVDLMIYGDVRELEHALKRLFPESSVKVVRLTNSLVLEGFVEKPEAVSPIIRLAEDYAPKIVNNITVGGVQQVLLKVKVMEVSRTKLRRLGIDWAQVSGTGATAASSISGLIQSGSVLTSSGTSYTQNLGTFTFGITNGDDVFAGFLDALQENGVSKILADPTITAVSGRPAHFNVGGELPIIIPSGIGQTTIEYKEFGTQVDFVPLVLGNGNIRLEVRPRVSEIDDTRSVTVGNFSVPALKVRQVDTGVELKAGQTLALAGLVQTRIEARERGLPFVSDLPFVGSAFRSVREESNEIELLILVTPELVDGLDPHEVPQCGPGMESVSPSNCQLYWGGHLEVPANGPCGPGGAGCYDGAAAGGAGCQSGGCMGAAYASDVSAAPMMQGPTMQGPVYSEPMQMQYPQPQFQGSQPQYQPSQPQVDYIPTPAPDAQPQQVPMQTPPVNQQPGQPSLGPDKPVEPTASSRQQTPYNYGYQQVPATAQRSSTSTPGLMGPIGYDVE